MISLDEVRSTIIETIKNLHATNYSTIPINYPNKFVVDLENFAGAFFVTVSVNYGDTLVATDITGTNAEVYGTVTVSTVFKTNTGLNGTTLYSNMLLGGLLFKTISGVNYVDMKSVEINPYPGYKGIANIIRFMVI